VGLETVDSIPHCTCSSCWVSAQACLLNWA